MEKNCINNYKLEKISDRMAKKYGKIREGGESEYEDILFIIENNLLAVYNKHEGARDYNSRRVIEAINLFLFIIKGYFDDLEYDIASNLNKGNKAYLDALQNGCDPFYGDKIRKPVIYDLDLDKPEDVKMYFKDIVKCLIRVKESVEFWQSEWGINGYFKFIQNPI